MKISKGNFTKSLIGLANSDLQQDLSIAVPVVIGSAVAGSAKLSIEKLNVYAELQIDSKQTDLDLDAMYVIPSIYTVEDGKIKKILQLAIQPIKDHLQSVFEPAIIKELAKKDS